MPNIHFLDSHPVGWQNPATMRPNVILLAAGTWDTSPLEISCAGASYVTLNFAYTRGAVGGDMQFRIETSPYSVDQVGVENWFRASILANGLVVSATDTLSKIQREEFEYGATAAGAETFVYGPLELKETIERIRVICRESGAIANPGICHVIGVFL